MLKNFKNYLLEAERSQNTINAYLIDFKKVKADGIQGAIIRAGYGFKTVDKCFKNNIKNALANGLHVGVYWFGYAYTVAQAKQKAEYVAKLLSDYRGKIDFPIFYD